jgi:hypothetical protein
MEEYEPWGSDYYVIRDDFHTVGTAATDDAAGTDDGTVAPSDDAAATDDHSGHDHGDGDHGDGDHDDHDGHTPPPRRRTCTSERRTPSLVKNPLVIRRQPLT